MLQRLHLAHSSDHRLVALVVSSHTLRVWVVDEPGDQTQDVPQTPCALEVQTGHVEILGLCFLDSTSLLCVHANGIVQLWRFDAAVTHTSGEALERALRTAPPAESRDVAQGRFVDRLDEPPIVSFVAPEVAALLCWEIELGVRLKSSCFRIHPETGTLYAAFGGTAGEVLWMSVSASFFVMTRKLGDLGSCVNLTAMCAEGAHVASSCRDHRVAIWRPLHDNDTRQPWATFEDSSAEIWALSFSGSARFLAGGGINNGIYLWDLESKTLRAKRYDHSGWISDLAWSDHDRVLASASWDNSVGVYRGNDLMPLYRLELHTDYVSSVIFIPDTTLLLSASYDRQIAIWDWSKAALVRVFDEHEDWIQALTVSTQGRFMSASSDRRVFIWSTSPLAPRASLIEGSLKSRIENRAVATAPGVELSGPAMALRADASPSDVGLALDKALAHRPPHAISPNAPPILPGLTQGVEEHTENFSSRKLTQDSESSVAEQEASSLSEDDSEEEFGPLPRPASVFGSRPLRIEGESLSSGRLRSPRPSDESGVHNLQEMSLAVDAVDVFKLIDSHSSPIVILPSGHSEAFSSRNLPSPPRGRSTPEQDATREINRDALKMLFRRHLDSEAESSGADASEALASAYSQPTQSPEEVSQSLFGDLTEVVESSLKHYIQNKKDSEAAVSSPEEPEKALPPHSVRSTLTDGERSKALRDLLMRARAVKTSPKPSRPAEDKARLAEPVEQNASEPSDMSDVSEPSSDTSKSFKSASETDDSWEDFSLSEVSLSDLSWPSDSSEEEDEEDHAEHSRSDDELETEDASTSTLEQALFSPPGEAQEVAEQERALSTTLDGARSSASSSSEEVEADEQESLDDSIDTPLEDVDASSLPDNTSASADATHEFKVVVEQEDESEQAEDLRATHEAGLATELSSSPEQIFPIVTEPPSEFSEALFAKSPDDLAPNPFKREQEDITVVGDHDLNVRLVEDTSRAMGGQSPATVEADESSRTSLAPNSVNLEEQEFFATPPEPSQQAQPKALPDDELTALADSMSSQPSERLAAYAQQEPSSPLPEDSSATVAHAGATRAAAEQALLQGVFDDAFASLHDAFKSEPLEQATSTPPEALTSAQPIDESTHALERGEESSSVASATPGNAFTVVEEDDVPAADEAPTATGSAHPVGISRTDISPAMATLLSNEESDSWYDSVTPVSPGDRTVAEDLSAPPSPAEAGLGDLPTNPGNGREHTSSGKPLPSQHNANAFSPSDFAQGERARPHTQNARPNSGDQTNPGMFAPIQKEMSGAAPFMGRPATASKMVDEVSANATSFGGIVYRPEVVEEPEKVGNEITADAFPEMEGAISEPISQSEFVSHTPDWDYVSVDELWRLRQATNQSAMKIFKRRASVSRQPWLRNDPIRAGLHNVFAASSRADAEYFCAGGAARHLSVWSLSEELIYQLPATGRIIYALTATPDGRILMSGDDKANIDLWLIDFDAGLRGVPRLKRAKFQGHTAPISHLATNSSGRLLLSAGLDGTARLWNLEDGACVSVLDHYGESLSACDFWGAGLVSVSLEGVLRLWDRRGIQIDLVEGFSPLTCVAAKRNKIYFGARTGEIFCYERGQTRALGKHDAEVSGMRVHLDGTLVSASRDGSIKVHYDDGEHTTTLHARAPLTCIDIDNARIIAGTENGNVEIFTQSPT